MHTYIHTYIHTCIHTYIPSKELAWLRVPGSAFEREGRGTLLRLQCHDTGMLAGEKQVITDLNDENKDSRALSLSLSLSRSLSLSLSLSRALSLSLSLCLSLSLSLSFSRSALPPPPSLSHCPSLPPFTGNDVVARVQPDDRVLLHIPLSVCAGPPCWKK